MYVCQINNCFFYELSLIVVPRHGDETIFCTNKCWTMPPFIREALKISVIVSLDEVGACRCLSASGEVNCDTVSATVPDFAMCTFMLLIGACANFGYASPAFFRPILEVRAPATRKTQPMGKFCE